LCPRGLLVWPYYTPFGCALPGGSLRWTERPDICQSGPQTFYRIDMKRNLYLLAVLALILGGCAGGASSAANIKPNFHFLKNSSNAVVIYSQVSKVSLTRIYMKPVGSSSMSLYTEFEPHPFHRPEIDQDGYQGTMRAMMVPAGEYEIPYWHRQDAAGRVAIGKWQRRFKLEPRQVMYLGRFVIDGELDQSTLKVKDYSADDLGRFKAMAPKMADYPVSTQLLIDPDPIEDNDGAY